MSDLYQPDRDLARRLLGGDEAAFEHFFDTFSVATLVTSAATLPYCVSGDEHPPASQRRSHPDAYSVADEWQEARRSYPPFETCL